MSLLLLPLQWLSALAMAFRTSSLSVKASCWEAADGHRPSTHAVRAWWDSRAIVVIACIDRLRCQDRVGAGSGADYVGERIRRQPGYAVIVGLARLHLVTGGAGVDGCATSTIARLVIPRRQTVCPSSLTERLGCHCATGSWYLCSTGKAR